LQLIFRKNKKYQAITTKTLRLCMGSSNLRGGDEEKI